MPTIKEGFQDLEHRYLFQETARRLAAYRASHPEVDLIPLGIGDVTRPLAPAVIQAMHEAVDDLSRQGLSRAGLTAYGGENAPYVWAKTPDGIGSWDFFDLLLDKAGVIVTPGSGFGREGEGWFRITSFNDRARTAEAMERIKTCLNGL